MNRYKNRKLTRAFYKDLPKQPFVGRHAGRIALLILVTCAVVVVLGVVFIVKSLI